MSGRALMRSTNGPRAVLITPSTGVAESRHAMTASWKRGLAISICPISSITMSGDEPAAFSSAAAPTASISAASTPMPQTRNAPGASTDAITPSSCAPRASTPLSHTGSSSRARGTPS